MPAAIKNIVQDLGATAPLSMVYRQGKNLPPVDLTGCAATVEIADRVGGAIVTLGSAGGGIALGTTGGEIAVDLAHASYAALPKGEYTWRLGIVFAGGETRYLVRGKWTIV